MKYITRIAPSPTGMMHFGTARTAYFNWLAARATDGTFILRMDDTDADRNQAEAEQPIFDGLNWLGLNWNAFYRQSARTEIYQEYANRLLAANIAAKADNGAIILNWHNWMPRRWMDNIANWVEITDDNVTKMDGRLVLLRGGDKLGQPTYQFASVVDDYLLGVNYIIRGTDHITNTAKQVAIWAALARCDADLGVEGRDLPQFAHVGLIFKGGRKMSKRDGAASLLSYKDAGYNADALLNFMLRLGWGPTVDDRTTALLPRERALELFLTGGKMRNINANYDDAKLSSFDRKYKAIIEQEQRRQGK